VRWLHCCGICDYGAIAYGAGGRGDEESFLYWVELDEYVVPGGIVGLRNALCEVLAVRYWP
jgi:hypothetical protein